MADQPLLLACGALGLAVFVGVVWLLSENRRAINWRLILTGVIKSVPDDREQKVAAAKSAL